MHPRCRCVALALAVLTLAGCAPTVRGASTGSLTPLVTPLPDPPMASLSTTSTTTDDNAAQFSTSTSVPAGPIDYRSLQGVAIELGDGGAAVSISVWRDGRADFGYARGRRDDGRDVTVDTLFVIASVSKLVTALTVARLVEEGRLDLSDPVPWAAMGVHPDPAWDQVTVRQLLTHTSGMPVARTTWLDDPGPCTIPLTAAIAEPPTDSLGVWRYSNGNYCALGLLVEHVTGLGLEQAANELVFEPADVTGPHLSTSAAGPPRVPYAKGLARLQRLGGAGSWLASTDDIAAMLSSVDDADMSTLRWPGIIVDQYGWGHTGTLDGAAACAWVLDDGSTVITAFVSGPEPGSGGKVCDMVVPALAADLGIFAGEPERNPL